MTTLTAHCLVKNEENFVAYAIKSVVNFVDQVIIFDTGSTDKTVEIIQNLVKEYPNKIVFEEKGECDPERHTQLRQEMIEQTKTDWFMILDGDEVWTERAMREAKEVMNKGGYDGVKSMFYECVGDIYHKHYKESYITTRFVKLGDVSWGGKYNQDSFYTKTGEKFFEKKNIYLLQNRFWHLTHLLRSSKDSDDFSSSGKRADRRIPTYFIVGRKITESSPEVFGNINLTLSPIRSFFYFIPWALRKIRF